MNKFLKIITLRTFVYLGVMVVFSSLCDFIFDTDITNKITVVTLFLGIMLGNSIALLIKQRKEV